MSSISSLDRITDLKAQIAGLEKDALRELQQQREGLLHSLAVTEAEITSLGGKLTAVKLPKSNGAPPSTGKRPSLQELKELLAAAPEKTISIRAGGYDLQNIKVLAKANPKLLSIGGKHSWRTVTLLK